MESFNAEDIDRFELAINNLTPTEKKIFDLLSETGEYKKENDCKSDSTYRSQLFNIRQKFQNQDFKIIDVKTLIWHIFLYKQALNRTDIKVNKNPNITTNRNNSRFEKDFFVGRNDIKDQFIVEIGKGIRSFLIHGKAGEGKTTLAKELIKDFKINNPKHTYIELPKLAIKGCISDPEIYLKEILDKLSDEQHNIQCFNTSINQLKQQLKNKHCLILVDNIEPALNNKHKFEDNRYIEIINALVDNDSKSINILTSRCRLADSKLSSIKTFNLEGLKLEDWKEFFEKHNIRTDHAPDSPLSLMHKALGGNAKAMEIFEGIIDNDYRGNMNVFWRQNNENILRLNTIEDLISSQFDDLKGRFNDKGKSNPYLLLCRLGCFRYQDVPTISKEAIYSLLWDIENERDKFKILNYLCDRALIEINREQSPFQYYLHPAFQSESNERLKRNKTEFEKTHQEAGNFFQNVHQIQDKEDAFKFFEACYHFITIGQYCLAADVIVKPIQNHLGHIETLGCVFYRLGLLNPMKETIIKVKKNVENGSKHCRLYNILGDIYWLTGDIKNAIDCHKESEQEALRNENADYSIYFQALTDFNIALCQMDILENDSAMKSFKKFLYLLKYEQNHQHMIVSTKCCLALLNSYFKEKREISLNYVNELLSSTKIIYDPTRIGVSWRIGYAKLFVAKTYANLEMFKESEEMYKKAIKYSEDVDYPQVRAKALTGLAEIYRVQSKDKQQLRDLIVEYHNPAIIILKRIGANPDLAEAYFQLALTHQKRGDTKNTRKYADKAISLWEKDEMYAPKQIERINQAIQDN